jgi:hypothetical protein
MCMYHVDIKISIVYWENKEHLYKHPYPYHMPIPGPQPLYLLRKM